MLFRSYHILHNSLSESNSLVEKYKRKNIILCEKVDNLKKKIQFNRSMKIENKSLFEGQECLSHACLFVKINLYLKVKSVCLMLVYLCLSHAYGILIVAVLVI